MHGLANRALQSFVIDTYGPRAWGDVVGAAELGFETFEPMLIYEDSLTTDVLRSCVRVLGKPTATILEDLGIYLVAHPNSEALRRLLRFGGDTFEEFLISLEDLPERARLAVPDLELPALEVLETSKSLVEIEICTSDFGHGPVLGGVLQGLADDYGVLATIELERISNGHELISVQIHDLSYAEGKQFDLAQRVEP
ncbi:MAG: heme NO-binding protein [Boseongicola sp.]|nr:MAG: heme NO-binding protein [Boseongicola sp.]